MSLVAHAKIISYAPEKIVIQADANKNALLFLSDNNYPGWIAKVDGRNAPIFTADHTFRSIVIPKGKHVISFSYQPESITIGFLLAGLGVLLFVLVGFTIRKRKV